MRGGGTLGVVQSIGIGVIEGVLSKEILHPWPLFFLTICFASQSPWDVLYYITIVIMCCCGTDLQTKGQAATDWRPRKCKLNFFTLCILPEQEKFDKNNHQAKSHQKRPLCPKCSLPKPLTGKHSPKGALTYEAIRRELQGKLLNSMMSVVGGHALFR